MAGYEGCDSQIEVLKNYGDKDREQARSFLQKIACSVKEYIFGDSRAQIRVKTKLWVPEDSIESTDEGKSVLVWFLLWLGGQEGCNE